MRRTGANHDEEEPEDRGTRTHQDEQGPEEEDESQHTRMILECSGFILVLVLVSLWFLFWFHSGTCFVSLF